MSFWPRTLRLKALVAVVLIALLAVGNVVALQLMLQRADNVTATLNIAGKLRLLSQRIALEALAEHAMLGGDWPDVQQRYADFFSYYRVLRDGGSIYGLQVRPIDSSLLPALEQLQARWVEYQSAIDGVLC